MKGIPNDVILHRCEELKITPYQLYEKLFNGEEIEFDLLCIETKCIFKKNNDSSIKTVQKFSRKVKF
jgi:hypothetical protein